MDELNLSKYEIVVEDLVFDDTTGNYYWNPEKFEIDAQEHLAIDQDNIDEELSKMGHIMAYYGDLAAKLRAQFSRKQEDIEAIEAELDKTIRDAFNIERNKDPKLKALTESAIKKDIIRSQEYQNAVGLMSASRVYYLRVNNLLKALDKKADAVIAISYNQRQERKVY